jgi:uncharacterized repeat protein (TIGR01451 family)
MRKKFLFNTKKREQLFVLFFIFFCHSLTLYALEFKTEKENNLIDKTLNMLNFESNFKINTPPACAFKMTPIYQEGYIKSSSPAITYYVLTITNTGTITDFYNLNFTFSGTNLTIQFFTLNGVEIIKTPSINPGESYSFIVRFDTPNGTQPNNTNITTVTATSNNCPGVSENAIISTYIYGGNSNPNIPNAPDLEVLKTAISEVFAGEEINYKIIFKNNSPNTAKNPAIKDIIPSNVDLISYAQDPEDTRILSFTYNVTNRNLNAVYNGNIINSDMPFIINIKVKTNCNSVPTVINNVEAYTVSGDNKPSNDTSTTSTIVKYDFNNPNVGNWNGSISEDWFDCRNWALGVIPTNNINAVITTSSLNNVIINPLSTLAPVDKTSRAKNLTIQSGKTVSMINQGDLCIAGNWNNNGLFIPGTGTVTFNGSTANQEQLLNDNTNKVTFYNLVINTSNNCKGIGLLDGYGLFINNNLDLINGDIRLYGKAQLIQTKAGISTNSSSGSGIIYRDQQGHSNKYNYNYWSSPVGTNNTYTVATVVRDGTNPLSPSLINWSGSYDGAPTNPITLSNRWIYKYQNQTNDNANWTYIGENGTLTAGQGFTLKGTGASLPSQNLTFVGRPNDGLINGNISANNLNLSGNPYPSALDAHKFIDDNDSSTTGTLYFWEHYTANASHSTNSYMGGYATLTKTGATPAVGINGSGNSNKIPGRYIPVGQGFFIQGNAAGGSIKFENTQRAFIKENEALSNALFRPGIENQSNTDNKKIRIGFESSATNYHRQLLLGFLNENATDGYDAGYDAFQLDTQDNDIYFPLENRKLVIQAKGNFNIKTIIPLTVKNTNAGTVKIMLDGIENFPQNQNVFIYDNISRKHSRINLKPFEVYLPQGTFEDRFSLRFNNGNGLASTKTYLNDNLIITSSSLNKSITIYSSDEANSITNVKIYNLLGQSILNWKSENKNQFSIELKTQSFNPGVYIIKISTSYGEISKKIILNP